jgi:hypothetical protein
LLAVRACTDNQQKGLYKNNIERRYRQVTFKLLYFYASYVTMSLCLILKKTAKRINIPVMVNTLVTVFFPICDLADFFHGC